MWAKAAGSGRLRECRHSRLRICFRSLAKAACGSWRKDQKEAVKQKTVREKESKVRRQSVPTRGGGFWAGGWLLSFSHESAPIVGLTLHPTKKRAPLPTVEVSLSHVVHYSPRNKPINGFTAGKALPNHGGRNIRGFGVDPHKAGKSFLGQPFCHIFMTLPVPNPSNGKEGAVAHRFLNAVPRIKGFGRSPPMMKYRS